VRVAFDAVTHVAVLAAEADGLSASFIDIADQLLVDRTRQHHFDDLDSRGIGDAQARGEFRLDAEPLQAWVAILRPAPPLPPRQD